MSLPPSLWGVGLGMNTTLVFLSASLTTASATSLLAARADSPGWNPLHQGPGAAFSDVYLLMSAALIIPLALSRVLATKSAVTLRA
jgi:hypothetical protein